VPLYRQLYDELREAVLTGRLLAGARLPSTRTLASDLGISRNTVMTAFEQLLAEGYFEGKVGSGTFVARKLPDELLQVHTGGNRSPKRSAEVLSRRGALLASIPVIPPRPQIAPRAFRPGPPAFEEFPFDVWAKLMTARWRRPTRDLLAYGDAAGYRPLREAIAAYIVGARGVRCDAKQVIVVAGSQQGLDLTARVLLDPGDRAWIEDPGYLGARGALLAAGAKLVPVPVDNEGINVAVGATRGPDARLIYASPSHQFPLGVTMSLTRRLALLEYATKSGAWIIEDDYDSQYRYAGRPLSALQGLDFNARVIYLGTFSKVMFPSLRLGYLVVPPDLVDAFSSARAIADRHSPSLEQAVLAEFITEGHLARHIRRMRSLYEERQNALVEAAARDLETLIEVRPSDAGMHLVGWLPEGVDDRVASEKAAAHGLEAPALSAFSIEPYHRSGLVLGYAAVNPREIREGIRRMADALRSK
jgi:GntR family transcriptional regulator/MocR family aminotransferase